MQVLLEELFIATSFDKLILFVYQLEEKNRKMEEIKFQEFRTFFRESVFPIH